MDKRAELLASINYLASEIEDYLDKEHLTKEESISLRLLIKMHKEKIEELKDFNKIR